MYKEIAERMHIQVRTVKSMGENIALKLGLQGSVGNYSNVQIPLTKWAIRNKIVEL